MLNEACQCLINGYPDWELTSSVVFGSIALIFSVLAYLHSRENFRLGLLEKRLPIYTALNRVIVILAGTDITHIPLNKEDVTVYKNMHTARSGLLRDADNILKEMNAQEVRFLFGSDIKESFVNIRQCVGACLLYDENYFTDEAVKHQNEYMDKLLATLKDLPQKFDSYMDFSSYKKRNILKNLTSLNI